MRKNELENAPPVEAGSIQLTHAAIMTTQLEASISFYRDILGLALRIEEEDPIRKGRQRAMLTDAHGNDIIELIEMPEWNHPHIPGKGSIHHVGFSLSIDQWQALRSRLDQLQYPYQEVGHRLFIRDADSLVIEVEHS